MVIGRRRGCATLAPVQHGAAGALQTRYALTLAAALQATGATSWRSSPTLAGALAETLRPEELEGPRCIP